MELQPISPEQSEVLEYLETNNVIVDSVAGSGKTTCALHIARQFNNSKILLLTYNARLKQETQTRIKNLEITNLEAYSYHSFCVQYYGGTGSLFTDTDIKKLIRSKKSPKYKMNFDIIILDESQDIKFTYYELICKIFKDNQNPDAKICIFGDKFQSIFAFNEADKRFIMLADKIFDLNSMMWVKCNLSTTYRLTNKMTDFVNNCLLNDSRMKFHKESNIKPMYSICNTFGKIPYEIIKTLLHVYKPEDIFILAYSIKSESSPARKLENEIKRNLENINVFVPNSDDDRLDDEIIKGKLVFSTFHQTKGLERKVIVIFGFDSSHFEYYNKKASKSICSNELYVAATRASEHLILLHDCKKDYLPFLKDIHLYCDVATEENLAIRPVKQVDFSKTGVVDLIRYTADEIVEFCFTCVDIKGLREPRDKIVIDCQIKNADTAENVSDITGIAIPCMFEYIISQKMDIFEALQTNRHLLKSECDLSGINLEVLTPAQLLYIANCWNAYKSGFVNKIYQIKDYNWLTHEALDTCIARLRTLEISGAAKFEVPREVNRTGRKVSGYIDCIDGNTVYEFKCVNELKDEHCLQLMIYMYMHETYKLENNITEATKYLLYNILTDQLVEISSDIPRLSIMMDYLLDNKYNDNNSISDVEFLKKANIIKQKYL